MAKLNSDDIPELPLFVSVAEAARILGISKTSVYYKIYEQGAFKTVYRVGGGKDAPRDDRPFLLLLRGEVLEVAQADKEIPLRVKINLWNKRIKDWGRANGYEIVNPKGRPHMSLISAFLEAHPEDTRPE